MNNLRKNNGLFQKRIHKYDIFLNSVPALPCVISFAKVAGAWPCK